MPSLYVLQGPDKGHTFEIEQSPALIGRNSPDLPLTDNTISRRHAELKYQDGEWVIYDLHSANGTHVNGVKVSTFMSLKEGDQIRCGTSLIVFGGEQKNSVSGDLGGGLRIDEDGNLVESDILSTVPSMEDSIILAGPETSSAVVNLHVLYQLATAISSIFDRQQLLETVMDMIFDALPADRGFILLKDDETDELMPQVVRYRSPKHSGEITVSHTIVNYVMSKQEGVICSNAMRDPRFDKGQSVHDYSIRSALCVPVSIRERNMGVIYVDTTIGTHTYSTEQLQLLAAIAFHTGLAIEHSRLFKVAVQAERLAAAGETVAYLSHGIKNLLQSLQGAADMVEMGLTRDKLEIAKKGWKILQRNLGRVQNLVLNMLAFSKVRKPNLGMTQVNQMIVEAVEMLEGQAEETGIKLVSELDESLPPIEIDSDGMQQVILNLILNAMDVLESGKGVISLKTHFDTDDGNVVVIVEDNGKGIEQHDLEEIFTAFHSSKGQAGTGLGLAVVKKTLREHGGSADVESEVGVGTRFILKIPTNCREIIDSNNTAGSTS